MKLEEMFASEPSFSIESKGKTYTLRIPNLEDRVKFKDILGDDSNIQKVFNELQWDVIAKLVYRLLVEKQDFVAFQEKGYNDDGVEVTYLTTGPALLMRSIKNIDEAVKMLTALINALRLGDPLIGEAIKEMSQEKKSLENKTGLKSSMSLPVSTDTPLTSSPS